MSANGIRPFNRISLLVTESCNLRCDYCFEPSRSLKSMSWETGKKAIDFLLQNSKTKTNFMSFFGGEPLMKFELIRRLTDYAIERFAREGKTIGFSITTNGLLLRKKVLDFARTHAWSFVLSIDGNRETHDKHRHFKTGQGSYDLLTENLPMILEYYPNVPARASIHPDTCAQFAENMHHLLALGFNAVAPYPVYEATWSTDELDTFKKEFTMFGDYWLERKRLKQPFRFWTLEIFLRDLTPDSNAPFHPYLHHCYAAKDSIHVNTAGEVFPCHRFNAYCDKFNDREKYCLGLIGQPLDQAKIEAIHDLYLKLLNNSDSCSAFCPAHNYNSYGTIQMNDQTTRVFYKMFRAIADDFRDKLIS